MGKANDRFILIVFYDSEQEEIPHHNLDEQSVEDTIQDLQSGSSSGDQDSKKQMEDKKLTEVNGEIRYYIKKGTQFIPTTNFSVACFGYVTEDYGKNCP